MSATDTDVLLPSSLVLEGFGWFVPSRRLEDKIRNLCALARMVRDDEAWLILSELRILLHQHVEHLRMVAAAKLSGTREFAERRSDKRGPWNTL